MAARLTVIVSQSARREGRLVDLEETLVTELMLAPGMDATLVGPLENIRPDSTDFLCLKGFQHSLALVSWLDEENVRQHWERLQLGGSVRRFGSSQLAQAGRIVYFFPLSGGSDLSVVLRELLKLQSDRSVKTVALNMPTLAPKSTGPNVAVDTSNEDLAGKQPVSGPSSSVTKETVSPSIDGPAPRFASVDEVLPDDEDQDWKDLDQLVQDFDALDL